MATSTAAEETQSGISQNFAWQCALTTLLSAILLFLVQPIISKIILPWFGGSPAVWTTCMLFFQTLLLAGYAYAHWLVRAFDQSWQMRIHAFMTLAAALTLPISPGVPSVEIEASPVRSILWLLGMNIGLPFFVISATGPLLQAWFTGVYPGRPPYRLYALSNVGSLAALWLFPLVLEPNLNIPQQDLLWSAGLGIYLVFLFVMSLSYERLPVDTESVIHPKRGAKKERLSKLDISLWLALPALASVLLCAVTAQICQDVAVVPFLLIIPLSLYLVTFILAFDRPLWYVRGVWGSLAVLSVVAVSIVMVDYKAQNYLKQAFEKLGWTTKFDLTTYTNNLAVETSVYLVAMFCVVMVCIGETTRRKPSPGHLTLFYLLISLGSAFGSALVAIVCPNIFVRFYELNIALVLGYVVGGAVMVAAVHELMANTPWRFFANAMTSLILAGGLALVISAQIGEGYKDYDVQVRNFYGVASVKTEYSAKGNPVGKILYNGKINHGYQFISGERRYQPNSYYAPGSGVDLAFSVLRARNEPLRVAVIGLGTGTLAAYGHKGDDFQFYEIDQKIADLANTEFTYLRDTPADVHVRMGDARLFMQSQLDKEGSQKFDLIVLDAFSGDAIPVHLLTLEALVLYRQHLQPNGILAVHTSNRHLKLPPVVARLAKDVEMSAVLVEREEGGNFNYNAASDWVLVSADPSVIHDPIIAGLGTLLDKESKTGPRWTDSFSNLWQVLD